jgi:hypothetical protein
MVLMSSERRGRGRPRAHPDRLARWVPPPGWVRVVAWVSPEERRALKRIAVEADSSVADLIRSLASGLARGVITGEELLRQVRKGAEVMEKIPTLFERGEDFKVVNRPKAGCEWVFAGEGTPTEKLDGTNIRITVRAGQVVRVEKRVNPTKVQKAKGIVDGWYMDADEHDPADRYVFEAVRNTDASGLPDGEHPCEALGPKIQGNPLGLEKHVCVPFNLTAPDLGAVPRDYAGLAAFLARLESHYAPGHLAEGIVFHHTDGRRAKIKRKDFPQ